MADITISDLPVLTAAQISDDDDIRFAADDLQATDTTKQISLTELITAVGTVAASITYAQTAVPTTGADIGLHSVQTGTYRGLYFWTGNTAEQVTPYSEDGDWPVT